MNVNLFGAMPGDLYILTNALITRDLHTNKWGSLLLASTVITVVANLDGDVCVVYADNKLMKISYVNLCAGKPKLIASSVK